MVLPGATDSSHDLTGKGSFFPRLSDCWWGSDPCELLDLEPQFLIDYLLEAALYIDICLGQFTTQQRALPKTSKGECTEKWKTVLCGTAMNMISQHPCHKVFFWWEAGHSSHPHKDRQLEMGMTGLHLTACLPPVSSTFGDATDLMWVQTFVKTYQLCVWNVQLLRIAIVLNVYKQKLIGWS